MADGRARPVSTLRVGDLLYGSRLSTSRQYAEAAVLEHWLDRANGYRIETAAGTVLTAGGDQTLLTYRGWKRVTGAEQGRARRPHLTLSTKLLGSGPFYDSPAESQPYRRGYLCGLIRGDGHIGSYRCGRPGTAPWIKHGFRLALIDDEPLRRAERYLIAEGVGTTAFVFQRATRRRREIRAIGNQTKAGVERVRGLIAWPQNPSSQWQAGYLAGIFDAEGSCDRSGALRICNTDSEILRRAEEALRMLHFDIAIESTVDRGGLVYLRLRGGAHERIRFFQLTDPVIARKRSLVGRRVASKVDFRVIAVDPLGCSIRVHRVVTSTGDLIAEGAVVGAGDAAWRS